MSNIIEFRGITKIFGAVKALEDVTFNIKEGSIHAIVGENGAGKSTLMNILGGEYGQDGGEVVYRGRSVRMESPQAAHALGVAVVYQEFRLCPNLTVTENLFLGREKELGKGRVAWPLMEKRTAEILASLGSAVDPSSLVGNLSIADQQIVEIARALALDAEVIIMDEPTSALTLKEAEELFVNLRALKARGVTVLYISHRLEEIFPLCDRISVLRDGRFVGDFEISEIDQAQVVRLIAGGDLADLHAGEARDYTDRPKVLEVQGLTRPGCYADVSFDVHEGEIVGIYGLQGSGRTEVLETIFGLAPEWSGSITAFGQPMRNRNPAEAIANGLAMIPENRRDAGIFPEMDITENVNTANAEDMSGFAGVLRPGFMAGITDEFIGRLKIKTSSRRKKISQLSGGNQQKVIIARWLAAHPRLVLVDELTRGIDVSAKFEIYKILKSLRESGLSILMVSSELAEILAESDRILVMKNGAMVADLRGDNRTKEQVIRYALSGG
jgi:ribose transport system ATP-binding protein